MKTDIEIIEKYQKGEKDNFALLYDKYIDRIYAFVYYKTHHKETAEDLVSQVFLKALKKIDSFNIDQGTFQAWLYQIARNTVIDHYRTKKNDQAFDDVWDISSDDDIERDMDTRQQLLKIEKYISGLKSEQRDILIMKIWQGMSYKEIADILGKSEASCKMMCSRTLKKLRADMPMDTFVLMLLLDLLIVK